MSKRPPLPRSARFQSNQLRFDPVPHDVLERIIRVKCGLGESEPQLYRGLLDPTVYPGYWHGYTMLLIGTREDETAAPLMYVPTFNRAEDRDGGESVTYYIWLIRIIQEGSPLALEHRVVLAAGASQTVIDGIDDPRHTQNQLLGIWRARELLGAVIQAGGRRSTSVEKTAKKTILPLKEFEDLIRTKLYPKRNLRRAKDREFAGFTGLSRDTFINNRRHWGIKPEDIREKRVKFSPG